MEMTAEQRAALDRISREVRRDHELRLDQCSTIPLIRRGRKPFRRPRTAIISRVCQEALAERLLEESEGNCRRDDRQSLYLVGRMTPYRGVRG